MPAVRPAVPITTVMTTFERDATSAAVSHSVAPAATSGAAAAGRLAYTLTPWPALSRCRAIGRPMTPRPMNPTFDPVVDAVADAMVLILYPLYPLTVCGLTTTLIAPSIFSRE